MIRPNVAQLWTAYNEDLEGVFSSPYCDVRGLITTAMGCLIDPFHLALALPWVIGERFATEAEIGDDWEMLKGRKSELSHWQASKQAPLTSIRLRAEAIEVLVQRRLAANVAHIEAHLMPGFKEFPADSQMGILSLAWAIGAGFDKAKPPRPEFVAACNAGDWISAKVYAKLRESNNAGVVQRNRKQEICFDNAQTVRDRGLDPAALWWPNVCPKEDSLHTLAVRALELGIARDDKKTS